MKAIDQTHQWPLRSKTIHDWNCWMARRVRVTLESKTPIYVWGEYGSPEAQVYVKVKLDFWDRVYQWSSVAISNWGLLDGSAYQTPIWLASHEWFPLCTIMDTRKADLEEAYVGFQDMVPVKGTGLTGLNEFDIERGAEMFFRHHGIALEVTYKDYPPELL